MASENTPDRERKNQPSLADRIRDAIDRLGELVDELLAPPPAPVPIPIRNDPRRRR